jgi:hypothetical protein
MKKKFIRSDRLSGAIKLFLKDLIDRGNCFVDVNDFGAKLHKIVDELPREAAIEWNAVEKVGLPLVSDEYIVMIAYADKPTVLYFDAEDGVFFEEKDDEDVAYKVTHWAEMPEAPYV